MKLFTMLFIGFLILIVVVANLGLGPTIFPFIYLIPGGDKIGHFLLMGLLSFLVNTLLKGTRTQILSFELLKGSIIVGVIVTLEELSQLFLMYRAFSLIDLIFDYAGIFIFGYFADYLISLKNKQP